MDFNSLTEVLGDKTTIALAGLIIGLLFGICAQRSRFCLRSAVVEFWNRQGTAKLAIWLCAFSSAVIATQLFIALGWLDVSQARQLSATGSLSGALVGGLLFGIGMILARGCSSRMLILAANGNLRALLTGRAVSGRDEAPVIPATVSPRRRHGFLPKSTPSSHRRRRFFASSGGIPLGRSADRSPGIPPRSASGAPGKDRQSQPIRPRLRPALRRSWQARTTRSAMLRSAFLR